MGLRDVFAIIREEVILVQPFCLRKAKDVRSKAKKHPFSSCNCSQREVSNNFRIKKFGAVDSSRFGTHRCRLTKLKLIYSRGMRIMNCLKCPANLRYEVVASLMAVLILVAVASLSGDEPKYKEKYARLGERLQRISDQELRTIVEGGDVPAAIGILHPSPERLNEAVMKELVRRLYPKLDKPDIAASKVATDAEIAGPELNHAPGVELPKEISIGERAAEPAEIKLANVSVESFSGQPFAVGIVELKYEPGHGPIIYPDQPLFLDATDQRAHYIAFDLSYQQSDHEPTMMVDRLRASFLLRGSAACQVSIATVAGALFEKQDVQPIQNGARHRDMLSQWWKQFSVIPTSYGREQRELKESLLDMLARRLQLPGPWPNIAKIDDGVNETSLEHQFERGIGMLFGIESVKLAMRADTALSQSGRHEKADQTVPLRPVVQSVAIPPAPPATWIEPIAMHVPAECFYLRTGSLANYRQFRQFLVGWGGSLNDIVSTAAIDHQSRARIEGQLGLSPEQFATDEFDKSIADMALIGCDPMFDDGASIGILFQARNSDDLASVLKVQRNQARLRIPESEERRVSVDGHEVSFLTSDDHRVRSFYAIDGDFHLVTNSYHLLSRFFQASNGSGSLGGLNEFRYARDQTNQFGKRNQQQPLAMLYLSDPFFQNLISPHYRIELTRRRLAAHELKQYQLALMIGKAERIDAVTTDQLIKSKLLPAGFGTRPDGSYPMLDKGKLKDSMRGALGYFLPIPDVPLEKATQTEVSSYHQFMGQYSQEWRKIDPVTVVFSRDKSDKDGLQQVGLDIVITPYARQHYALLTQYLAPARDQRVAPMKADLVSLDTSIRAGQGSSYSHLLYLGLRDADVPYVIENGQIKLTDRSKGSTYAKSNSYAAISPPNTGVLQLLASAFSRVQRQQDVRALRAERTQVLPPPVILPPVGGAGGFSLFGFFVSNVILKSSDALRYIGSVSSDDNWMVASTRRSLRQDVLEEISQEKIHSSSQVRLRVKSLTNSKVEPYIQAHTYLASRQASSENARFLNDVTSWLQLPIKESRDSVETVLGAQLRCPLGGDFGLSDHDGHSYWAGTQWPETSYFSETKTPASWKFAFLDWLNGLDLRFDIDQTTLRAHIDMLVRQPVGHDGDDQWTPLKLQGTGNSANAIAIEKIPVVVQADFQSMPTWVLGIQVQAGMLPFRIASIHPNSPAARTGLSVDDQILAIDRVKPESSKHLAELIKSARDGKGTVSVRLLREGSEIELEVPLRTR